MTYKEAFYNLRGKLMAMAEIPYPWGDENSGENDFFIHMGKDETCEELLKECEELIKIVKKSSGE